jgi:3-oxoacyl-[acyl-carrier-protein] synthase-1
MSRQALAISGSGMVCGVGLNAPASCAAIRCAIDNFQETRFMDEGGEWIIGSTVPFDRPWQGRTKLIKMIVPAIQECLNAASNIPTESIPLLLSVSEPDRPGRISELNDLFFKDIKAELGAKFHEKSKIITKGHISGVRAAVVARELIYNEGLPFCLVAGVDSLLVASTLAHYEEKERLLTSKNSNGFIPGEAGAAVLLGPSGKTKQAELAISGIGFGKENATIESEEPLRADGLVQAFKEAFLATGLTMGDMDYRITDANGEQYFFKEGDLAVTRTLREHKGEIDIWHPSECIGEVGAATVPCILAVAESAARKAYSRGNTVLCHFTNDDHERAAMILIY